MSSAILQYVLIILLIIGLGYFIYLLKDKNIDIKEDYFGIAYTILASLEKDDATQETVKKILRAVSESVKYVETNFKNDENMFKEEEALKLAKEYISLIGLKSPIDDNSIRYIIRLACTFLPKTTE